MGAALDWYVSNFCRKQRHDHGEPGQVACLISKLAELQGKGGQGEADRNPKPLQEVVR